MAGIGVRLNRIYKKDTLTTTLVGAGYSTLFTAAPMLTVIVALLIMQNLLDFSSVNYARRELFSCTVLYIFVFSLLATAPFSSVISRYLSDLIYEERFEDILPSYYTGLLLNMAFVALAGIPFCIHEHWVGNVDIFYVFLGYCGYIAVVATFYSMIYLSICKEYFKIFGFFFSGMVAAVALSTLFDFVFHLETTVAMLLGLVIGFLLIAALELSVIQSYFKEGSDNYKGLLLYMKEYAGLALANFFYMLGMYVHNFVFWTTEGHVIVADSFVTLQSYDMATCLAMFTNVSCSVIFISRIERRFHDRYKAYTEAITGGRGKDIKVTKYRLFRLLSEELMELARVQFIITLIVFFLCMVMLPGLGFGGLTLRIYPCLAAGYFILFLMYAEIVFLYYFSDYAGAAVVSAFFCLCTLGASLVATNFTEMWYGMGLVAGSFAGWSLAYVRLQWVAKNIDAHIFCSGRLLKKSKEAPLPSKVYDRDEE